jgi:hypothetical protein
MVLRFTATLKLKTGKTFQQRHGYFKIAYRWVMEWHRKGKVASADIFDIDRTETAWNSVDGLLLKYRTVKPEDAPPFFRPNAKPDYTKGWEAEPGANITERFINTIRRYPNLLPHK